MMYSMILTIGKYGTKICKQVLMSLGSILVTISVITQVRVIYYV